jgi:hypothetical protein
MDETVEEDVVEEIKEQVIEEPVVSASNTTNQIGGTSINTKPVTSSLSFDNIDYARDESGKVHQVDAPKSIDRLEEISTSRALQRKLEEMEDDDDEDRIKIHTDTIDLSGFDILDNDKTNYVTQDFVLDDIEVLDSL